MDTIETSIREKMAVLCGDLNERKAVAIEKAISTRGTVGAYRDLTIQANVALGVDFFANLPDRMNIKDVQQYDEAISKLLELVGLTLLIERFKPNIGKWPAKSPEESRGLCLLALLLEKQQEALKDFAARTVPLVG